MKDEKLRLTDKCYWQSIYDDLLREQKSRIQANNARTPIKRIIGEKALNYWREHVATNYSEYVLWDIIYKKYLPVNKDLKILEIGSAPGYNLVKFNREFGFVPYGVEYSESGVELNKKIFVSNGLDSGNVIYTDFFENKFLDRYRGFFDIVISRGFIEHFDNPDIVMDRHIDLLAAGGHLIVTIPNLKGLNYIFTRFFNKGLIPMHNFKIMDENNFSKLFNKEKLVRLFCGYYGAFSFGLFNTEKKGMRHFLLRICLKLQLFLNIIFYLVLGARTAGNKLFSSALVYIGVKK